MRDATRIHIKPATLVLALLVSFIAGMAFEAIIVRPRIASAQALGTPSVYASWDNDQAVIAADGGYARLHWQGAHGYTRMCATKVQSANYGAERIHLYCTPGARDFDSVFFATYSITVAEAPIDAKHRPNAGDVYELEFTSNDGTRIALFATLPPFYATRSIAPVILNGAAPSK